MGARAALGPVDGISRDEGGLRRDGVEETLLIEANAVLAATVGRAVVARASNLGISLALTSNGIVHLEIPHTFLLRQYLQAMAVRWRGAAAGVRRRIWLGGSSLGADAHRREEDGRRLVCIG